MMISKTKKLFKSIFSSDTLYNFCVWLYIKISVKVLGQAYGVLLSRVLINLYENRNGLNIKTLNESAIYVTDNLIKVNRVTREYDEKAIYFGESILSEILDNEDIRCALVRYLQIGLFYYSFSSEAYKDTMSSLEGRLNQLGISERIDSSKNYFDLYGDLNKTSKRLKKQLKMERNKIVSEGVWDRLGGRNFSFKLLGYILGIIPAVYLFGSFLYIHFLLSRFGLDASNYVTWKDYIVLTLSKVYEMKLTFILLCFLVLRHIYTRAKTDVMESEYEVVQSKSDWFKPIVIYFLIFINVKPFLTFYITGNFDSDEIDETILIDIVFFVSFLIGRTPLERIFINGFSVRTFLIICVVFIGGLMLKALHAVADIKSFQTSRWEYSIEDEILTSDQYSLVLESSKYVIFYHKENKSTRIIPIEKVGEISTYPPPELLHSIWKHFFP